MSRLCCIFVHGHGISHFQICQSGINRYIIMMIFDSFPGKYFTNVHVKTYEKKANTLHIVNMLWMYIYWFVFVENNQINLLHQIVFFVYSWETTENWSILPVQKSTTTGSMALVIMCHCTNSPLFSSNLYFPIWWSFVIDTKINIQIN